MQQVIDYAGPWEVFGEAGFKVFTVAEKRAPINAVFGQKILPDYTFANSPTADILLVPGGGVRNAIGNPALIKWVQTNAQKSKQVMSVCYRRVYFVAGWVTRWFERYDNRARDRGSSESFAENENCS